MEALPTFCTRKDIFTDLRKIREFEVAQRR